VKVSRGGEKKSEKDVTGWAANGAAGDEDRVVTLRCGGEHQLATCGLKEGLLWRRRRGSARRV
jgi:hypothetical protein